MALSLVAFPPPSVTLASSIAASFPTGYSVVANDLAVLVVVSKNRTEATVPSTTAPWTQVGTGLGGVTGAAADAGRLRITVFTRVLQAGDVAPTITQTGLGNFLCGFMYIYRGDVAGTFAVILQVLSQATSTTAWSQSLGAVPAWTAGDELILPMGATTDSVTGVNVGTLVATGLTLGTITEDLDFATTQGDDARIASDHVSVTAGPTGTPTRALTLSGIASTGAMGVIRIRHTATPQDVTITPSLHVASATFGTPIVIVGSGVTAFTLGQSLVGALDQLGFGATTDVWVTLLPLQHVAEVTFFQPLLWGSPALVEVTELNPSVARVSWSPVLAADGYMVERDGVIIVDDVTATQYDDTTVTPGGTYNYRVQAFR